MDSSASDVLSIANRVLSLKSTSTGPLIANDGAVGDPTSVGVAVLLANWTRSDLSDDSYSTAAEQQLNYLLDQAPRTADGAISQRSDQVQLWADFVYMAPPFIAYYGALQGGDYGLSLLKEAYNQCKLYRQYLHDGSGLWKHIVLGSWHDNNHWATGNGWAAAGMLRVMQTIKNSDQASNLTDEQDDLSDWIMEILDATWPLQNSDGALHNYLDNDSSFDDSSSTALLASVTYRMAAITGDYAHIDAAAKALSFVKANIDDNGWLTNTVDPYTFNSPSAVGSHSPEGQAFVILLQAATERS